MGNYLGQLSYCTYMYMYDFSHVHVLAPSLPLSLSPSFPLSLPPFLPPSLPPCLPLSLTLPLSCFSTLKCNFPLLSFPPWASLPPSLPPSLLHSLSPSSRSGLHDLVGLHGFSQAPPPSTVPPSFSANNPFQADSFSSSPWTQPPSGEPAATRCTVLARSST